MIPHLATFLRCASFGKTVPLFNMAGVSRYSCLAIKPGAIHPPDSERQSILCVPQRSLSLLGPEKSIAAPDFKNRWAMAVPAFITHLCIGIL